MVPPPGVLAPFPGWDNPPWRAHTSASILVADECGDVAGHVLIDCGAGVVDCLVCSGLAVLDNLAALLITHWHPDHVLSLNQLCESVSRSARRRKGTFSRIPVWCTQATYDWLTGRGGFAYEFKKCLQFQPISPGVRFTVPCGGVDVSCLPLPVAHSGIDGAVIFAAEIAGRKAVFAWDINEPSIQIPNGTLSNQQVVELYLAGYRPDVLFMACNTWAATGTGHTSFQLARTYIQTIGAKNVYLTHLSGHEDGPGMPGYGWTDAKWECETGMKIARQGMVIRL